VRKRLGLPDLKPTETMVQFGTQKKPVVGKPRRALKKLG